MPKDPTPEEFRDVLRNANLPVRARKGLIRALGNDLYRFYHGYPTADHAAAQECVRLARLREVTFDRLMEQRNCGAISSRQALGWLDGYLGREQWHRPGVRAFFVRDDLANGARFATRRGFCSLPELYEMWPAATRDRLGAWLLKANPGDSIVDIDAAFMVILLPYDADTTLARPEPVLRALDAALGVRFGPEHERTDDTLAGEA